MYDIEPTPRMEEIIARRAVLRGEEMALWERWESMDHAAHDAAIDQIGDETGALIREWVAQCAAQGCSPGSAPLLPA